MLLRMTQLLVSSLFLSFLTYEMGIIMILPSTIEVIFEKIKWDNSYKQLRTIPDTGYTCNECQFFLLFILGDTQPCLAHRYDFRGQIFLMYFN